MTKQRVLDALSAWVQATDAFSECERGLDKRPVLSAATTLASAVADFAGRYGRPGLPRSTMRRHARNIVVNLAQVTSAFTSDEYGDDDTDAPRDVEWDVHRLLHAADPKHVIPDEIEPAHVVSTVFPHPSDEE